MSLSENMDDWERNREIADAARGTMACPICGVDTPHSHWDMEIEHWIDAQASRFGMRARAWRHDKLPDDLRWFVREIYLEAQHSGDYDRLSKDEEARVDEWTGEIISFLRHAAPERQCLPSLDLLASLTEAAKAAEKQSTPPKQK